MPDRRRVFLVDDEEAIRRSATFMLRASGYNVTAFETGEHFLEAVDELGAGCVLLDVRMPGISGLEVQQVLKERSIDLPIIIMTGHGDIMVALQAMNAGAVDFIEKPFDRTVLFEAIADGFARLDRVRDLSRQERARARLEALAPLEREVLHRLVRGHTTAAIAQELDLAPRRVETLRAGVMQKLEAASTSELLRLAFAAGLGPA